MSIATRQNWTPFAERIVAEEAAWIRGADVSDQFVAYAEISNIVWEARNDVGGDWDALERWNWQQKLILRLFYVDAFRKMDEYRLAHPPAPNEQ